MHAILAQDQADIVVAVREARMEPLLKRLPAQIFWGLYRRYVVLKCRPAAWMCLVAIAFFATPSCSWRNATVR